MYTTVDKTLILEVKTSDATKAYDPHSAQSYLEAIKDPDMRSVWLKSDKGIAISNLLIAESDIRHELDETTRHIDELILSDVILTIRDMIRTLTREDFIYGDKASKYYSLRIA